MTCTAVPTGGSDFCQGPLEHYHAANRVKGGQKHPPALIPLGNQGGNVGPLRLLRAAQVVQLCAQLILLRLNLVQALV